MINFPNLKCSILVSQILKIEILNFQFANANIEFLNLEFSIFGRPHLEISKTEFGLILHLKILNFQYLSTQILNFQALKFQFLARQIINF